MDRLAIGQSGEDRAVEFLQTLGYTIVQRNLRYPVGEIDILAKDKSTFVIVEVKAGKTGKFGYAIERVGPQKQRKLRQLAARLSQDYPQSPLRVDVINVDPNSSDVLHLVNAVEAK